MVGWEADETEYQNNYRLDYNHSTVALSSATKTDPKYLQYFCTIVINMKKSIVCVSASYWLVGSSFFHATISFQPKPSLSPIRQTQVSDVPAIGISSKLPLSISSPRTAITVLFAKKAPKKKAAGGGGFGAAATAQPKASVTTISADKGSLEKQWDTFTSITDLEIVPPKDSDAQFEVVDVFVRCNVNGNDKWFRIGKCCTGQEGMDINAALTLQKGLIFWTAVHMRRELVAAGGKSGAASLELGYMPATMNVGSEADGPLDEEEEATIQIATKPEAGLKDVSIQTIGFRPDWNPPGFTYKRREKAAMKKKTTSIKDEIASMDVDNDSAVGGDSGGGDSGGEVGGDD